MAKVYKDRVWFTTATTGTGAVTVGSGVTFGLGNFLTPSQASVANGDTFDYLIVDGNNWEVGTATYTSGTTSFTRSIIQSEIAGTVGTTLLTLSGTANVMMVVNASSVSNLTALGNTVTGTGSTIVLGTSPTFTTNISISSAGASYNSFNRPAGNDVAFVFQTSGVNRWRFNFANSAAESGSNAGSDFQLLSYTDAGAQIGTALYITRSNLLAGWGASISVPAGAYYNFGATFLSSGYGFFDNGGTVQAKNSGGSWGNILTSTTVTGDLSFTGYSGTIANNAVTNAKAAQMAAMTFKGNNTVSLANASDLSVDQMQVALNVQGQMAARFLVMN